MLQDYRHDYLERLQQAMTSGMSASDCHNYQRFIGTLDDAIVQQQGVLQQADENLNKGSALLPAGKAQAQFLRRAGATRARQASPNRAANSA